MEHTLMSLESDDMKIIKSTR